MTITEDIMAERIIPTAEFPTLRQGIQELGISDIKRAEALGVAPKTVERLRTRLPASMYPFVLGPRAEEMLTWLLADVRRRKAA